MAKENKKRGEEMLAIAQTQEEKEAANKVIQDAAQHAEHAKYLSKRAYAEEAATKKKCEERKEMVKKKGEAVIQRKQFSDSARANAKKKADAEMAVAEKRLADAQAVVAHVEAQIKDTLDQERGASDDVEKAKLSALEERVREEDKTKREKMIAKVTMQRYCATNIVRICIVHAHMGNTTMVLEAAATPEIAQLAEETRFSNEYIAQLQVSNPTASAQPQPAACDARS